MKNCSTEEIIQEIELNVADRIQLTDYYITFNINEPLSQLVDYLTSKYPGTLIALDISGSNIMLWKDREKRTLAECGITTGTAIDIVSGNDMIGG
jgi:hypothetical protein